MIKYQLICEEDHEFEGWFGDSAAFESQQESGLLTCPSCGTAGVRRALMAPNLASPKTRKSAPLPKDRDVPAPPNAAALPEVAVRRTHARMSEMRVLQSKINDECRDVVDEFAEEARKIHHGEVESEGTYGKATE